MAKEVTYRVALDVEKDIIERFEPWLEKHVLEMLALPTFTGAEILTEDTQERHRYVVHYRLKNRVDLDVYFEQHAEAMRADGLKNFPNQFSASREILISQKEFTNS